MSTGTRALELLGLLQHRRHWSGADLADRLGVSRRTLRRDVGGLVELGYPITTTRGTGGGYRLGSGAVLPPLVLSEDEAAAVVLGLKEVTAGAALGSPEAALGALAKIVQVLPPRIRRRIDSLRGVAVGGPGAPVTPPVISDVAALTTLTLACRDAEMLAFGYRAADDRTSARLVQPHHVVTVDRRLYLVAWDLERADWRTFRLDRVDAPRATGARFARRTLPIEDPAAYVLDRIGSLPSRYPIRATVHAPAARVRREVAHWGTAEPIDASSCTVSLRADSLAWATFCLAAVGAPLTVHEPPEAVAYAREWGERLLAATEPPRPTPTSDA